MLHLWSGLGYYRRARQLHATAREVATRYGGVLPAEAEALRALPGIGAYTAGAIASIAYGRREPLVDGNVARVLARLEGMDEPVRSPSAVRRLWAIAARLLPDEQPGRFNEALMELGATVCTPRDPRCDACPVARFCVARAEGREQELPVVEQKRAVPVVEAVAAVLLDGEGRSCSPGAGRAGSSAGCGSRRWSRASGLARRRGRRAARSRRSGSGSGEARCGRWAR